ncbi:MAG: SDR family oxidoreductase [Chitinophagales bacterium]|nr:SDR family oxidoreductase [Chitinophagales bacterium]MCZ2394707.1 SDR family oxidoreductase [Chitinophagales bacterium]
MKILIIGASGLVGSNCLKYLSENGNECIGTYYSYAAQNTVFFDTLNLDNAENFNIDSFQPEVIIHCGALTHVDYCEQNEEESYKYSITSTVNVIQLAKKYSSKIIFISTDYIFDGKNGPYDEQEMASPISVYGRHKWEAEQAVSNANLDYLILRITNVYGDEERGKNFVARIIDQALKGQHLTLKLPIDQYATPINAADIAKAIALLLENQKSGIYNIASTDYMNRVQLSLRVLKYFPKATYDLIPLSTEKLHQAARRPLQGGLKSAKFLTEFPDFIFSTVDDYVQKKISSQ